MFTVSKEVSVYECAIYNLSINNILITHQRHIPHLFCPFYAAFGESGFGKKVVMDIFVGEQLAALYEGFQNAEIDFLIRPFALSEKGGVFILLSADFLKHFTHIVGQPEHILQSRLKGHKKISQVRFGKSYLTNFCLLVSNQLLTNCQQLKMTVSDGKKANYTSEISWSFFSQIRHENNR